MDTPSLKDTMTSMHDEQVLMLCNEICAYENILETMKHSFMPEKVLVHTVISRNLKQSKSKLLDLRLLEDKPTETTGFSRCGGEQ